MHLLHKFLIIAFACSSSLVWALPSDREQPINIEADHAQMDDQSGVTQYKGNAILTQGTLRIEGDTITFFFDDDKNITKAIAQGKLAKYQQTQKEGETPVKARAIQMEYYADRQKIYLIGEGHIIQNGDEFTGNTIQYDIAKGLITANSQPVTVAGETKAK
jgi:lipopolysaccharide export system protein LptA